MDINSAVGRKLGVTDQQLADLANFEQSGAFSQIEKAVLRYAQGMSVIEG